MSQSEIEQRQRITALYEEATAAIDQGNWQEAAAKLDGVVAAAPDYPGAAWRRREAHKWRQLEQRYEIARRLLQEERWAGALHILHDVKSQTGGYRNVEVLISIGMHHRRTNVRVPALVPVLIERYQLQPAMSLALIVLGAMLFSISRFNVPTSSDGLRVAEHATELPDTPTPVVVLNEVTPTSTNVSVVSAEAPTGTPTVEDTPGATATATLGAAETGAPPAAVTSRPTVLRPILPRATSTRTPTPAKVAVRPATATASFTPLPTNTLTATPTSRPERDDDRPPRNVPSTHTPTRVIAAAAVTPRAIAVAALDFRFEPATLSLSAGDQIRITLTNKGSLDHDWVLTDLTGREWVRILAAPGQSITKEFTLPVPGVYKVVCDIGDHEQQGMAGKVFVH